MAVHQFNSSLGRDHKLIGPARAGPFVGEIAAARQITDMGANGVDGQSGGFCDLFDGHLCGRLGWLLGNRSQHGSRIGLEIGKGHGRGSGGVHISSHYKLFRAELVHQHLVHPFSKLTSNTPDSWHSESMKWLSLLALLGCLLAGAGGIKAQGETPTDTPTATETPTATPTATTTQTATPTSTPVFQEVIATAASGNALVMVYTVTVGEGVISLVLLTIFMTLFLSLFLQLM